VPRMALGLGYLIAQAVDRSKAGENDSGSGG
jgi:hypothetical protein